MATVHPAHELGAVGESPKLVAMKRLHPELLDEHDLVTMFRDEAAIASRVHHPNVVPVLDVVTRDGEMILVQPFVHGVPLSRMLKRCMTSKSPMPIDVAVSITVGVLAGLHAAHEATDDMGESLGIVHRDVSPQNVLVSVDGIPKLVDFGIAKAKISAHHTRDGFVKGKLAYMSPEQLRGEPATRHADIYAAAVVLWELVTNRRLQEGLSDADFVRRVILGPSLAQDLEIHGDVSPEHRRAALRLAPILRRAMSVTVADRWSSALDMAMALVEAVAAAPASRVAGYVTTQHSTFLEGRWRTIEASERALAPEPRPSLSDTDSRVTLPDDRESGIATIPRGGRRASVSQVFSRLERAVTGDRAKVVLPWAVIVILLFIIAVLTGAALAPL